jgi:hypothetical protein
MRKKKGQKKSYQQKGISLQLVVTIDQFHSNDCIVSPSAYNLGRTQDNRREQR